MELGEKLRQTRQAAGLSQRQLCGDAITRNMLSQIEHGTARPSMDTLRYLAGRLGKPMSFFLEEDVVMSPNQALMLEAREAYAAGAVGEARALLQKFHLPDPLLEWEWTYLSAVTAMEAARQAMAEEKYLYAQQLLETTGTWNRVIPELERQRLLLLGKLSESALPELVRRLPSLDEELLLRAEAALVEGQFQRAEGLLEAAEDRQSPRWQLLRGRALMLENRYAEAVQSLQQAECSFPERCWPLLEVCFRELRDYQKAYHYACKQR